MEDVEKGFSLKYLQNFFNEEESKLFFEEIITYSFEWTFYVLEEKVIRSPRKMIWMADDPELIYYFSQNHLKGLVPKPFTSAIRSIKERVEALLNKPFNSVLINMYVNGKEASHWHSDDDPWLGEEFAVPSVSFGCERQFSIRPKDIPENVTHVILENGSLCVMDGTFQKYFQHSVLEDSSQNIRINLTFRNIEEHLRNVRNSKLYWHS